MTTRFLCFSCLHAPITHSGYFDWLLGQIEEHKPDVIVNLGDWYEGLVAKRFTTYDSEDWTCEDEHEAVGLQASAINKVAPKAKKVWIWGNHDDNLFGNQPDRLPKGVRSLIKYTKHVSVAEPLKDWSIRDRYDHREKFRLGPVTFQHGCAHSASAEKDGAYLYGVPYGLYVQGHTHRPLPVTQARERKVNMAYWYANPGCGMDWDKANYMARNSMALWGRGCIVGDTAGAHQHRTAYASKQWDAELRVHSLADERFL
jgi:predicted phosphodiesterase